MNGTRGSWETLGWAHCCQKAAARQWILWSAFSPLEHLLLRQPTLNGVRVAFKHFETGFDVHTSWRWMRCCRVDHLLLFLARDRLGFNSKAAACWFPLSRFSLQKKKQWAFKNSLSTPWSGSKIQTLWQTLLWIMINILHWWPNQIYLIGVPVNRKIENRWVTRAGYSKQRHTCSLAGGSAGSRDSASRKAYEKYFGPRPRRTWNFVIKVLLIKPLGGPICF